MKLRAFIYKDPIIRQVILLVLVATFGFLLNLSMNSYLFNITEKYSKEANNQLSKKELGTFLHSKIIKIKSSMQELLMNQDSRITKRILHDLDNNIDEINDLLSVLAKGGCFVQLLPVNFYQNNYIQDSIIYTASESNTYNLEIIDIVPKIIELQNISKKIAHYKVNSFSHPENCDSNNTEILILYKQANTYLERAFENSNRIFYETKKEYQSIKRTKEKSVVRLKTIKSIWVISISFLTFIILIIIFKNIIKFLEIRNANKEKILKNQMVIEKILDTIPVGFIIFNKDYRVERVNKQAVYLFDAANEKTLIGKGCVDLFEKQDHEICPFLTHSSAIANNELKILTLKGESKSVLKNATLLDLDGDKVVLETFIDITKRKEIEEQLIKAKEMAIIATQEKSKFLASMSHEIRTPLNGIIGMASLLEKTELNSQQNGLLDIIQISSTNLVAIISDILDFSKIEAGELEVDLHTFHLRQEIENNLKVLRLKADEKSISFSSEIDVQLPEYIISDSTRIKQVIINLVTNAIKFTSQGSVKIQVKYQTENNQAYLLFKVIDSGVGIPDDKIDKIFMAFSQSDSTITRNYGGTGLGLTISKELIDLLKGEIGVISELGKGSTFWFKIPFTIGEAPKQTEQKIDEDDLINKSISILLAEDNIINQKVATAIFKKLHHEIHIAKNGKIAVDMYMKKKYDLVFMDLQMPIMDGLTAAKHILDIASSVDRKVFIAAMTANAMKEDKANCLKAGMCYFLSKPYKLEDIKEAIKQYHIMEGNVYCK